LSQVESSYGATSKLICRKSHTSFSMNQRRLSQGDRVNREAK
jgi:hypothetical protein